MKATSNSLKSSSKATFLKSSASNTLKACKLDLRTRGLKTTCPHLLLSTFHSLARVHRWEPLPNQQEAPSIWMLPGASHKLTKASQRRRSNSDSIMARELLSRSIMIIKSRICILTSSSWHLLMEVTRLWPDSHPNHSTIQVQQSSQLDLSKHQ